MTKNDIFTVKITALSSDGNGVGRHDGVAVFVPFAAVGDKARVRAVKIAKSVVYAIIEEIVTPSPARINNDCPVFGKCGGCDFRHITYEAELTAKEGFIRDAFTRIGGLTPAFLPIIGSEDIDRYRNKAQFPVCKSGYGFYAPRSHRIVPIADCLLQPRVFSEIADFVIEFMREKRVSAYDEASHTGVVRHICIRKGHYGVSPIYVTLVARRRVPEFKRLARELTEKFPRVTGVSLNINKDKTNAIFGGEWELLAGNGFFDDMMCGLNIKISPQSFYQVNTPAAEKLYGVVKEFAEPDDKVILDLYCGIGAIGLSLAGQARKIIGVEAVESAVLDARENARINGFRKARFIHADSKNAIIDVRPDVVILDPSRKGCERSVLENVAGLSPERIVMASCDAATAARDCKILAGLGYKTVTVQGVDLFPRTRHVECCCQLTVDS